MGLLNKITIKSRMVLAFTLMLIVFVLFGIFSLIEMNKLDELTTTLYEHPLQVSNAALRASMGLVKMHRGMKDVALSRTEVELQNAILTVQSQEQVVYKDLSIVKRQILGVEGRQLEQETRKAFAAWKRIRDEVIALVVEGNRETAALITKGKGADHVYSLERKMMELTAYAIIKADDFMESAHSVQRRIIRNTIIIIGIVALLSFLIAFLLIRSILSNVSALKNTMSEITKTGSLFKSELVGNNEITEMAQHFNGVIDRLEAQFWLKDGQTALSNEMSGDFSFEELVTKTINFVSRYVDACSGALYVFREENSVCELKASYALVERKYLSNEFKLGEGVVGQVAVEKKPILLKGITREEALGETGTISEPPKSIYAVPLLYEEKLYGVMEMASFEEIDNLKMEFLDTAAKIVSIALYTATQREEIKAFLETTQNAKEQLEAQSEELQFQAEELQQTSDELQKQNIELNLRRQQVEEANRLKGEFLSNMSHELRTPLNSVMALSRVLMTQTKDKLSGEEVNYLEIIERNGQTLLSLINDILDLSKIEAGPMDVSPRFFSVSSTIEMIMERLGPVAEQKGIEMIRKIPAHFPKVESDEARVHQILQNLIGNAVKFTEKGRVTVSARSDVENVYIEVADTGIGISEKDLLHIFEEFRQVDGTLARPYEGTGLGLTIAHKAAKMLGGDLSVESTLGKRSTFKLTLPIKWEGLVLGSEPLLVEGPGKITPKQKTILIVDDEPNVVSMIADYLSQEGYYTLTATSGKQALRLAEKYQPFAIALDIMMPDMDGFEVLDRLRSDHRTKDLPVIVVTAKDLTTEDREKLTGSVSSILAKSDTASMALLNEIKSILAGIETNHKYPEGKETKAANRILLVEDNEAAIIQVRKILESEGYDLDVAHNGQEALEYVKQTIPDGIILDLMMSKVDGFEVLDKILSNKATAGIPVLVLTAKELTPQDRKRLRTNNIQQLIQKGDVDWVGLLFKIRLMLGAEPGAEHETRNSELVGARRRSRLESSGSGATRKPKSAEMKGVEGKPTVLVIEDNADNMMTIKAILLNEYNIREATDGEEGLNIALTERPDLVLLDMSLPKMDGYQVVREIKKNKEISHTPVIALTARAMKGDREKIIGAGCDDYISKPIDHQEAVKKIKNWLRN